MNPCYYPAHLTWAQQASKAVEDTMQDDTRTPAKCSGAASLRNFATEDEKDEEEEEDTSSTLRPRRFPLMDTVVITDIAGRHNLQPVQFPWTGSFLLFEAHWKKSWFKVCRTKFLRPCEHDYFTWGMTIVFSSGCTMALAADTWPIVQEYISLEWAEVSGMRLQVDVSTSRRARSICQESEGWSEATRLLQGVHCPAPNPQGAAREPSLPRGNWFTRLVSGCRKGVQSPPCCVGTLDKKFNAEAKVATEEEKDEEELRGAQRDSAVFESGSRYFWHG